MQWGPHRACGMHRQAEIDALRHEGIFESLDLIQHPFYLANALEARAKKNPFSFGDPGSRLQVAAASKVDDGALQVPAAEPLQKKNTDRNKNECRFWYPLVN